MDKNRVIGKAGSIPWKGKMHSDMHRFYNTTLGRPIIMGRKTYESIGRALPGRTTIVLSRSLKHAPQGTLLARAKAEALLLAEKAPGGQMVFISGGAGVYAQFMDDAQTLCLTIIEDTFSGDAYFPAYDKNDWGLIFERRYKSDAKNAYPYQFLVLDRQ